MIRIMKKRTLICCVIAVVLAACSVVTLPSADITIQPVALYPDDPTRRSVGRLIYAGGVSATATDARFGGWSAIEVSPDGRLLALSDRGTWMTADLIIDDSGMLVGMDNVQLADLLGLDGSPLRGLAADAEGLAPLGHGRYAVSFERRHRLWSYHLGGDWRRIEDARAHALTLPPGAELLPPNAGIEGLALSGGSLWAGLEYPLNEDGLHPLWQYDPRDSSAPPLALSLSLTPGFGLTGLAGDGEGGLFILERFWSRAEGNRIGVFHLDAKALAAPNAGPLLPQVIARLEPDMTIDNIEGLAITQLDGELRLF